jgi:hypothetical protein
MELITQAIDQTEEDCFQGHLDKGILFFRAKTPQHGQGKKAINGQMTDLIDAWKCRKIEGVTRLMRQEEDSPHHNKHGDYTQEKTQLIPSD